jgi:death on curing protein
MIDITAAQIVDLHRRAIERHGGDGTLKADQLELVKAKLDAAMHGSAYLGRPDDPLVVAALLLKYLARSQIFVDGNKRVAWSAAVHILLGMGATLACTENDAADFVLQVAEDNFDSELEIVEWFAVRLAAATAPCPDI